MISKKNDEKCFCAKAELFDEYIKKTGVTILNSIVEESGMNETARKEAEKILNRLKSEGQNSAESGMLYDYLDLLLC